jgi:hypothetical protein
VPLAEISGILTERSTPEALTRPYEKMKIPVIRP